MMSESKMAMKKRAEMTQSERTKRLVQMAMLAAISVLMIYFIRIPFPLAPYMVFDMADVPILLGAFTLGPVAGLLILLVVCLIQAFLLGGNGIIGMIMHFVSSAAFILVAGYIYRRFGKNTKSIVIGLVLGALATVALIIPFNIVFTPMIVGGTSQDVLRLIVPVLLPFNLVKVTINAVLFFLLFKGREYLFKTR